MKRVSNILGIEVCRAQLVRVSTIKHLHCQLSMIDGTHLANKTTMNGLPRYSNGGNDVIN